MLFLKYKNIHVDSQSYDISFTWHMVNKSSCLYNLNELRLENYQIYRKSNRAFSKNYENFYWPRKNFFFS